MQSIVFSHPGSPPFARQAARALLEADLLSCYATGLAWNAGGLAARTFRGLLNRMGRSGRLWLQKRSIPEIPGELQRPHWGPGLLAIAGSSLGLNPIRQDRLWERAELWFDRGVARSDIQPSHAGCYCYEFAALETFRRMKALGGTCILDLPIAHHAAQQRWIEPEMQKYPEVITPYQRHLRALAPRRNLRKDREIELADIIVSPSKFVSDSLREAGIAEERIWTVPFGAPPVSLERREPDREDCIFVVAGSLSIRKGIHYVLQAWQRLPRRKGVALWLVGDWQLPESFRQDLREDVIHRDRIPHEDLLDLMGRAHLLLLPTLAEGFALVILESMSRGTAVLTTPNSGAEGFIEHGVNGWMVEPGSVDQLVSVMQSCIERPLLAIEAGYRAAETARGWQWADYRAGLAEKIRNHLQERALTGP